MAVYALSGARRCVDGRRSGGRRRLARDRRRRRWLFVAWITAVNLLYLLSQIVMAADGCGVGVAHSARRWVRAARARARWPRSVSPSWRWSCSPPSRRSLAATALGLIGFVPFVGLAVLPLQLLALVLRGAGAAVHRAGVGWRLLGALSRARVRGRRARQIRWPCARRAPKRGRRDAADATSSASSRRPAASSMSRPSAAWARWRPRHPDVISFAAGYPAAELFPLDELRAIAADLLDRRRRRAPVRPDARLRAAARGARRPRWRARQVDVLGGGAAGHERLTAGPRPDRARAGRAGRRRARRAPTFTGAISAFGNARPTLARRRAAGRGRHRPRRPRRASTARLRRDGQAAEAALRGPELPEPHRAAAAAGAHGGAARRGPSGATA